MRTSEPPFEQKSDMKIAREWVRLVIAISVVPMTTLAISVSEKIFPGAEVDNGGCYFSYLILAIYYMGLLPPENKGSVKTWWTIVLLAVVTPFLIVFTSYVASLLW